MWRCVALCFVVVCVCVFVCVCEGVFQCVCICTGCHGLRILLVILASWLSWALTGRLFSGRWMALVEFEAAGLGRRFIWLAGVWGVCFLALVRFAMCTVWFVCVCCLCVCVCVCVCVYVVLVCFYLIGIVAIFGAHGCFPFRTLDGHNRI